MTAVDLRLINIKEKAFYESFITVYSIKMLMVSINEVLNGDDGAGRGRVFESFVRTSVLGYATNK